MAIEGLCIVVDCRDFWVGSAVFIENVGRVTYWWQWMSMLRGGIGDERYIIQEMALCFCRTEGGCMGADLFLNSKRIEGC